MDNEERRRSRSLSEAGDTGGKMTLEEMREYVWKALPGLSLSSTENVVRVVNEMERRELVGKLDVNAHYAERLKRAFPVEKTVDQGMM